MPVGSITKTFAIATRQFLVVRRFGKWRAKSFGRFGLPYSSEARAIRATIERAEKVGKPATVARFTKDGAKVIWTLAAIADKLHTSVFVAAETHRFRNEMRALLGPSSICPLGHEESRRFMHRVGMAIANSIQRAPAKARPSKP